MKKFLTILASLLLAGVCLSAQTKTYVDNGGVDSKLNSKIDLKRNTFHIDIGAGNAVEAGFHTQLNFNNYVSWDIISARYSYHYIDVNSHQVYAMTGVRGYTPAFGKSKNMKCYLAADFGYGGFQYCNYKSGQWIDAFAYTIELGIYLSKHFYLGVSSTPVIGYTQYGPFTARLGFEF